MASRDSIILMLKAASDLMCIPFLRQSSVTMIESPKTHTKSLSLHYNSYRSLDSCFHVLSRIFLTNNLVLIIFTSYVIKSMEYNMGMYHYSEST